MRAVPAPPRGAGVLPASRVARPPATPRRRLRRRLGVAIGSALLAIGLVFGLWPQISGLLYKRSQKALATNFERGAPEGAWGRIQVPSISLDAYVVKGVGPADLRKGPGHYPHTARPAQGVVGIAGHRTTFGAPFDHLDRLGPGDEIRVTVPEGWARYVVDGPPRAYDPRDWSAFEEGGQRLVLTTCHPRGSARERLVVTAVLSPLGAR